MTLGGAHVAQSDDVRVLGVQLSSDLSLDKHVNVVSAKCFFNYDNYVASDLGRLRVDLRYDMTWVRLDSGYEITWVRVDLVRVDLGYELTVNRLANGYYLLWVMADGFII